MELPICNYEDYLISDKGEVFSLKHKTKKLLKDRFDNKGYKIVNLCKNGKAKNFNVHRLVAEHFISNPHNYLCVNHKDGIKVNNCVSNLEWCTYSDNNNHAIKMNLIKTKLNCKQVQDIRKQKNEDWKMLASKYNVSYTTIYDIMNGKTWKFI